MTANVIEDIGVPNAKMTVIVKITVLAFRRLASVFASEDGKERTVILVSSSSHYIYRHFLFSSQSKNKLT